MPPRIQSKGATSEDVLQRENDDMIEAITTLLLPQTSVLTPNSLEARRLVQLPEDDQETEDAAENESAPRGL